MAPKKTTDEPRFTTKTTYSLASPYPEPTWPKITPEAQSIILDLLCQLLSPIGEHRQKHVEPSKGKREQKKKRKRDEAADKAHPPPPPVPAINEHILVGYNSTHRALESIVQANRPGTGHITQTNEDRNSGDKEPSPSRLGVVFVDRSSQPPLMHNHLPLLVSTASNHFGDESNIWLVPLPNGSELKLCEALGIPRVGLVSVELDAPGGRPLIDYVQANVELVDAVKLRVGEERRFQPLKMDTCTTKVLVQPSKSAKRQQARQATSKAAAQ